MNLCIISGRLGQDPQTRYTGGGKAVANFSIATQSGTGESKVTTWIPVVAWEGLAERAQSELKKGSFTTVTGRLAVREWQNKEGVKQKTTEVIASSLGFPSEYGGSSGSGQQSQAKPAPESTEDEELGF